MTTDIPHYHESRIILSEMNSVFEEFIGGPDVIDVGETLRVMLGDYFYGEPLVPLGPHYTNQDRTLVFPFGVGQTLHGIELDNSIEALGEIFWTVADIITNKVLRATSFYTFRPNECFYKFFPHTRELIIYTPVFVEIPRPGLAALDGRAVMQACSETLPSHLKWKNTYP